MHVVGQDLGLEAGDVVQDLEGGGGRGHRGQVLAQLRDGGLKELERGDNEKLNLRT